MEVRYEWYIIWLDESAFKRVSLTENYFVLFKGEPGQKGQRGLIGLPGKKVGRTVRFNCTFPFVEVTLLLSNLCIQY